MTYVAVHIYLDSDTISVALSLYAMKLGLKLNNEYRVKMKSFSFYFGVFASKSGVLCRNCSLFLGAVIFGTNSLRAGEDLKRHSSAKVLYWWIDIDNVMKISRKNYCKTSNYQHGIYLLQWPNVMIWNSLFCFCLCFCIFIIFHYQYYSVLHSVSSCTRVPQSRLCVSVRSEPDHVPSLRLHNPVFCGTLVFSKDFVRFSFFGISHCCPYLHSH